MHMIMRSMRFIGVFLVVSILGCASKKGFEIKDGNTWFRDKPSIILGLRCSNALIHDQATNDLIAHLPIYKSYGLNTVSVYIMGSRYGDVKGYKEDASLNQLYMDRLARIIEAADQQDMIVLVGVLYWGGSESKWESWTQKEAELAVYNTVKWLADHDYKNVFVDVDNEGMAMKNKGFDPVGLVRSAKDADPSYFIATNFKGDPPPEADLGIHFSNKVEDKPYVESEGTPDNAPGNYWGKYSKKPPYYNYINIGIYTDEMKARQIELTREHIENGWGYMLASTWLQCVPPHGPNAGPGGDGTEENPGIQWWLDAVKEILENNK